MHITTAPGIQFLLFFCKVSTAESYETVHISS